MTKPISDVRRDYGATPLNLKDLSNNPFQVFSEWLQAATESELLDPTAFVLSTVDKHQKPDSRVLLLKEIIDNQLTFFSNNLSPKALQLSDNPNAAMVFYWAPWARQVRIKGQVSRVTREESVAYFKSRPIGSQISAAISNQSEVIENREVLENKVKVYRKQHEGQEVPCPEHWQGYALTPTEFEFFQGRDDRLHDRFRYQLKDGDWVIDRLSP